MYSRIFSLILFLCISISGWSQPFLLSSGHQTHADQNLSVEWTLGEFGIASFQQNQTALDLGFHATVVPLNSTSDANYTLENAITLFPNPTARFLYINTEGPKIIRSIVIDYMGRQIREFNDPYTEIDLHNLNPGIYAMQFFLQGGATARNTFVKM